MYADGLSPSEYAFAVLYEPLWAMLNAAYPSGSGWLLCLAYTKRQRISTTKIMNERIIDETKQGTHTHFLAYCLMLALPWWCGTPTNWARRSLAIVWVLNQASVHHLSTIISQQSILSANHLGGTYECKLMKNETKYYN